MWLVYCIFILLTLFALLAFLEDRLEPRTKIAVYYCAGFILMLMAGLREIGFDPDSEGYENYFRNKDNVMLLDAVDYSFLWLCSLFSEFTDDVHSVFLFYAAFGVFLKLGALTKFSDNLFLMLFVYLCYYFELHETTQIRTGILSGCMLFAIYFIAESRRWIATLFILLGTIFHMSGITLLPLLFLNNKPIDRKWFIFLSAIIPVSYVMPSFMDFLFAVAENIPYIGSKVARYQAVEETGIVHVSGVNIFSPFHLFSIAIYYFLLYYSKIISEKDKYFPILMRIFAISLFFYSALSFLPVLGERLCMLYKIVIIILFADLQYTLRPRWCGLLFSMLVSFVYLNYIMRSMYEIPMLLGPST